MNPLNTLSPLPLAPAYEAAAALLIRPWETAVLVDALPSPDLVTESVAAYLRSTLARGFLAFFSDGVDRSVDLWRSPGQTLLDGGGDCEDLSILAVSLLLFLGVPARLVLGVVCDPTGWFGHAWVEGQDGRGFFFLEPMTGTLLRQRPPGYLVRQTITPS